jgi:hypothetical protein
LSKRDRRKQRKQKKRERRLRQEKHARSFGRGWDPVPDWDDVVEPTVSYDDERLVRTRAWLQGTGATAEAETLDREWGVHDGWHVHHARMIQEIPAEQAQELAFQALEVQRRDAGAASALARRALAADADCLDAIVHLAGEETDDPAVRYATIVKAITRVSGLPRFAGVLAAGVDARDRLLTRPFARAYLSAFWGAMVAGKQSEAIAHFEALEDFDRTFTEATWGAHVGWLLEADRLDDARRVLDRHRHTDQPQWLWAAALARFLSGDRAGARRSIDAARMEDDGFEDALLHGADRDDATDLRHLLRNLGPAWRSHAEALAWLDAGAPLTTSTERVAALRSYRPPVAALLVKGQPAIDRRSDEGIDQGAGFAGEDAPELMRMLDDQALHDLQPDEPGVWAPAHAARALGRLATPDLLPSLMEIAPRRLADPWVVGGLRHAVARSGAAAIPVMAGWLAESGRMADERRFAAETLMDLGEAGHAQAVIPILTAALGRYCEQAPSLNETIAWGLLRLRAVEAEAILREAHQVQSLIAESLGPWEEVHAALHGKPT